MNKTMTLIAGTYQSDRCGIARYTACLRKEIKTHGIASIFLTTVDAAKAVNDTNVRKVVKDWGMSQLLALLRAVIFTEADLLHIQHAAGSYSFERAIFLLPFLLQRLGYRKPIVTTVHEYGWWEWQPPTIPPLFIEWLKT